jgi:hypothetical protein
MHRHKYGYTLVALLTCALAVIGCAKKGSRTTAPAASSGPAIAYRFDNDAEGWTMEQSSVDFAISKWDNKSNGVLHTDGVCDSDPGPNAWGYRSIALPSGAKTLRYSRSAHDRGSGTTFNRVRLVDSGSVSHTLQDWEMMSTGSDGYDWVVADVDISAYAGQTVTIYLELNDDDGGGNNQTYWDDIEILNN